MNATAAFQLTAINRGIGEIKIHRAGCADLKREARGASTWNIEARTHEDVIRSCFSDMIDSGEGELAEYMGGVDYVACCKDFLRAAKAATADPTGHEWSEAPFEAAAPAQRTRTAQADIILAFLADHRGTAYTPHQIAVAMGHKGLRDACKRLAAAGTIEQASDKPVSYRLA